MVPGWWWADRVITSTTLAVDDREAILLAARVAALPAGAADTVWSLDELDRCLGWSVRLGRRAGGGAERWSPGLCAGLLPRLLRRHVPPPPMMPPLPPGSVVHGDDRASVSSKQTVNLLGRQPGVGLLEQHALLHCRAMVATVVAMGVWYASTPVEVAGASHTERHAAARTRALFEALLARVRAPPGPARFGLV